MTRTYCDRCGSECTNGQAVVYMRIIHRTSQGEWVGEDETKPKDLCHTCGEVVRKLLGLEVVEQERNDAERRALRLLDAQREPYLDPPAHSAIT